MMRVPFLVLLLPMSLVVFAPTAWCQESGAAAESPETTVVERARMHFAQGIELAEQEHWEAALALFDESLRLHPTQAAQFNRGLCLRFLNRYPEAIEAFMRRFEQSSFTEKGKMLENLEPSEPAIGLDPKERRRLQKLYRKALVERSVLIRILSAWFLTLPAVGLLAAVIYKILEVFI